MELVATIQGGTLSMDRWIALIGERDELRLGKPRNGINPFTKEPVAFEPNKSNAWLDLTDGARALFWWAEDGSVALCVSAEHSDRLETLRAAREIAVQFDAEVIEGA